MDSDKLQKERIENYFSLTAGEYRKKYLRQNPNFQIFNFFARRDSLISLLKKGYLKNGGKFSRCLDIGCGSGDYLVGLLDFAQEVIGADCAEGMLLEAKKNINGSEQRIKLHREDIEKLTFPDNYFDFIICAGVFEYLYDDNKAYLELFRTLKRGGCAFITFPNSLSFFMQLDRLYLASLHFGGDILSKLRIFELISGRKRSAIPSAIHRYYSPFKTKQKIRSFGFKYKAGTFSGYGSFYLCNKLPYYNYLAKKLEYLGRLPLIRYCGLNYIIQLEK